MLESCLMTRYPKNEKTRKWTPLELKAIPPEWKGDTLSDGEGLSGTVRVNSKGDVAVRFQYIFRIGNKTAFYQCGTFPTNDLSTIRENRDQAKKLVSQGIDPRAKKEADKVEARLKVEATLKAEAETRTQMLTFGDLFNVWVKDGVNRADKNKSLLMLFRNHALPTLEKITIKNLSENDLRKTYRKIISTGKQRTAVALSNDIRQMLRWAEKRQPWRLLLADGNPSDLVDVEKLLSQDYSEERTRVLSAAEIRTLHNIFEFSADNYKNADCKYDVERPLIKESQIALWICLSTLCRIGELLLTEWSHVNFKDRTWFIPKENVKGTRKNKQSQFVYLSDFALAQFEHLHALTGNSKWAFPAKNKDSHVCVKSVSKQVGDRQTQFKMRTKELKNRVNSNTLVLGNQEWTPHDLRRTGATMMQELKVPLDVIDRCQNHVLAGSKVRRHYMHYEYADEKQDAWAKLGKRLEEIIT